MIKEYKKKDGSKAYLVQVYLGIDPVTGQKKSTTRRGFATKKEAEVMEARLKVSSADGTHTTQKNDVTVSAKFMNCGYNSMNAK